FGPFFTGEPPKPRKSYRRIRQSTMSLLTVIRCWPFVNQPCPLYPQERTCAVQPAMSAFGHKRTLSNLFDHIVGENLLPGRGGNPSCVYGARIPRAKTSAETLVSKSFLPWPGSRRRRSGLESKLVNA